MALHKTGGNMLWVGVASDHLGFTAYALRGAVAGFFLGALIVFDEHCIIDFTAEGIFNRVQIDLVAIGG